MKDKQRLHFPPQLQNKTNMFRVSLGIGSRSPNKCILARLKASGHPHTQFHVFKQKLIWQFKNGASKNQTNTKKMIRIRSLQLIPQTKHKWN